MAALADPTAPPPFPSSPIFASLWRPMPPVKPRPYLPIAVGFYLLALPLAVAALFGGPGSWVNWAAAATLLGLGLLLHRKSA